MNLNNYRTHCLLEPSRMSSEVPCIFECTIQVYLFHIIENFRKWIQRQNQSWGTAIYFLTIGWRDLKSLRWVWNVPHCNLMASERAGAKPSLFAYALSFLEIVHIRTGKDLSGRDIAASWSGWKDSVRAVETLSLFALVVRWSGLWGSCIFTHYSLDKLPVHIKFTKLAGL